MPAEPMQLTGATVNITISKSVLFLKVTISKGVGVPVFAKSTTTMKHKWRLEFITVNFILAV